MNAKKLNHHVFAFYFNQTISFKDCSNKNVFVEDTQLYHRLIRVLRFSPGSSCILFDHNYHATVIIEQISKKSIEFFIESFSQNNLLLPEIILFLPVLKKQALAEAVYAAAETGVSEMQLITTQKVQRSWGGAQELERLQNVIIAACEQAKYFTIPNIKTPISLETALLSKNGTERIFFDAAGSHFGDFLTNVTKPITVLIGPEGDLTSEEKKIVQNYAFQSIRLTPTILRASQAVAVGIGILRSMI